MNDTQIVYVPISSPLRSIGVKYSYALLEASKVSSSSIECLVWGSNEILID